MADAVKRTMVIAALASAAITLPALGLVRLVQRIGPEGFMGVLSQLILAGGISIVIYLWLLRKTNIEELRLLEQTFAHYWPRRNEPPGNSATSDDPTSTEERADA